MIGLVQPLAAAVRLGGTALCGFVMDCASVRMAGFDRGRGCRRRTQQLSAEQSRQVAETIREEIARRRISRQTLAEQAKLSLSTLEKVLGGRRPFTLATTVRLEQALGVSLRKGSDVAPAALPANGDVAPDGLGAYSRRAVTWLEGIYVTVRPSFGDKEAIYAYRTEIAWEPPRPRWSSAKANGRMPPMPSSAKSRCRTSPATSISSPTGTASIA